MLAIVCNYSPHNDVVLNTVKESPVLQRESFTQNEFERSGNPVPTVEGEPTHYLALSSTTSLFLISMDVREAEVATHEVRCRG